MPRLTPTAVIVDGILRELGSGAIHCEFVSQLLSQKAYHHFVNIPAAPCVYGIFRERGSVAIHCGLSRRIDGTLRKRTGRTDDIDLSHLLIVDIPSSPTMMMVYIETARASLWLRVEAHTSGRRLSVPWIASSDDGMFRNRETRAINREMSPSLFHLRSCHCTETSLTPRFRRLWYISKARERGYEIVSTLVVHAPSTLRLDSRIRGPYTLMVYIESSRTELSNVSLLPLININNDGMFRKLECRAIEFGSPPNPNDYGTYRKL
ncbi:hypothetical protein SCHPADRAFT_947974 [Schizopora paradoxa]|uniref:Uncharacterized protein n=1 Tax=Schizopora paradoxa TaxID=27342 RepID=A0A0H2R3N0_9AGAM|nr:hypothetical protein SCHPADRAFT_947974 [Schizopora paradoxa]